MFALILAAVLIPEPPKTVATFEGKVVSIADGDTITVLVDRKQVKVRLEGVDAPENSLMAKDETLAELEDKARGERLGQAR